MMSCYQTIVLSYETEFALIGSTYGELRLRQYPVQTKIKRINFTTSLDRQTTKDKAASRSGGGDEFIVKGFNFTVVLPRRV